MNESVDRTTESTGPQADPVAKSPAVQKRPGADWFSALYAIILLFVFIATFQLYFSMQDIIRTWISDQFVPVFNTIYYIVIIVVGIWLIRDYIRRQ
jgi:threonine/homoserine/homoserine lactone efflux protein